MKLIVEALKNKAVVMMQHKMLLHRRIRKVSQLFILMRLS